MFKKARFESSADYFTLVLPYQMPNDAFMVTVILYINNKLMMCNHIKIIYFATKIVV